MTRNQTSLVNFVGSPIQTSRLGEVCSIGSLIQRADGLVPKVIYRLPTRPMLYSR